MQSLSAILGFGSRKPKARRKASSRGKGTPRTTARRSTGKTRQTARKRTLARGSKSQTRSIDFFGWVLACFRQMAWLTRKFSAHGSALALAGVAALLIALWASGLFGDLRRGLFAATARQMAALGMTLDNVEVSGRQYTSKDILSATLGLRPMHPALDYDIEAARKRIEELDWVEHATVMRQWPSTLKISLVEKRPIAVWQLDGKFSLIDRKGEVISSNYVGEFSALPQLVGPGAAEAGPELVDMLSRFPLIQSRLRAAIRVGNRRWTLRLDNGIDVQLPDEGVEEALDLLTKLDEKDRLLARRVQIIDMRDKERLYLRLTTEQPRPPDQNDKKI